MNPLGGNEAQWFSERFDAIRAEVGKAVVGQTEIVDRALVGMAAGGHILLEGMPGLGKTLLVRSLAQALSLDFSRIQFTPDMMPADVTGTNILDESRMSVFRPGPIFGQIVLADEINRATPKTQSAMLEAMQEHAVTVGGVRHALKEPFLVLATQNPIEQEGTYPLPEAQLDRFFAKLLVPFPTKAELAEIVMMTTGTGLGEPRPVATGEDILRMREIARGVPIARPVLEYGLGIVVGTHPGQGGSPKAQRYLRYGASPRGGQSLVAAAKIRALREGRFNVSKEDLDAEAPSVLRHRIGLNFEAEADGITADEVVADVVASVRKGDRDPISV